MLRTKDQVLSLLESALSRSPGDATELVYIENREATTRFAENVIHQNMDSSDARVIVRLVKDERVAISSTNDLSDSGLDRMLADAAQIASLLEPDPTFAGFSEVQVIPPGNDIGRAAALRAAYFDATAQSTPGARADAISQVVSQANESNVQSSGLFQTEAQSFAIVNSLGVRQWHRETRAELSVSASDDSTLGQGWSIGVSRNVARVNVPHIGQVAIDKAVRSRNPVTIPTGNYTVILEPPAVGQLLLFLGFLAFSGKSFAQGRGVLSGRLGEKVTGDNVTIFDDPLNPLYPAPPFDFEGVPKRFVMLIKNGVARGVAHDLRTGKMAGVESTGHALPPDNARGPYPKNLGMAGGKTLTGDMIASTSKGVLITHFWYLNYLNPMKAQLTGTTRDGTFLIEDGKITKPIVNMRANPAMLEVLSRVEEIGYQSLYSQYSATMLVPFLKISEFPLLEDTKS